MLFKSTTLLKQYAQLTGEPNFLSLQATLRFVETFHISAILGKELYKSLDDAYTTSENSLTDPQKALLEQCRRVIGPYLCYYYAPKADVQLSDGGMSKNKDAAYQYQGLQFREANLREGEMCEELLLQFLEDKKADYTEWSSSAAFKEYRSLFIKTGTEFNNLVATASPQRNYWAMRTKMVDVEEQMIRMAIGDDFFTALKAKDTDAQDFSDEEKQLLLRLKKAIAYQTISLSIPMLNVRIDASGLSIVAAGPRTSNDQITSRANAQDNSLSLMITSCEASAKMWLSSAVQYCNDNATALSFTKPVAAAPLISANDQLSGAFGMC